MRTPIEALKEIRDRLTYFCLRTDGKYDPPWATELVGIIDEAVTNSHKPDPDWKAICEKCHDGDIEPDCKYYGEPNGCNSPIYGEHPKAKPVGNAAAMREALKPWIAFAEWLLENAGKEKLGEAIRENGPIIRQRMEELRAALSAPPRNCDMYKNSWDVVTHWDGGLDSTQSIVRMLDWLLMPAVEQRGEVDGR